MYICCLLYCGTDLDIETKLQNVRDWRRRRHIRYELLELVNVSNPSSVFAVRWVRNAVRCGVRNDCSAVGTRDVETLEEIRLRGTVSGQRGVTGCNHCVCQDSRELFLVGMLLLSAAASECLSLGAVYREP